MNATATATVVSTVAATTLSSTSTEDDSSSDSTTNKSGNLVISSTIAALIAVLLIMAVVIGCLLSKRDRRSALAHHTARMRLLDEVVPAMPLDKWKIRNAKKMHNHMPDFMTQQLVCVICLDPILGNQQIRGLRCHHVFHRACIDDWYLRMRVDCPLCKMKFIKDTSVMPYYPTTPIFNMV